MLSYKQSLALDEVEKTAKEFKTPILFKFYHCLGVFILIIWGLFSLLAVLALCFGDLSFFSPFLIVSLLVAPLVSIFCFGASHFVLHIARVAYHTQSIDESLTTFLRQGKETVAISDTQVVCPQCHHNAGNMILQAGQSVKCFCGHKWTPQR